MKMAFIKSSMLIALLGTTLGLVSENLETVNVQMNRWHSECEASLSKSKGKGHYFRQCMKDKRTQARMEHAMKLRTSLSEEMKELQNRKRLSKTKTPFSKQDRPHILLITTDQQRQDSLGCYGDITHSTFKAHTPHIDRLAKSGMIIEDAWAASPVCSPSRTSILLGVHVPVHGVIENGLGFYSEERLTPFVQHLTNAGYMTGLIGKAGFSPMPYDAFTHLNVLGEGGEDRDAGTSQYDYLETYLVNCSMQWILERDRLQSHIPWFLHLSLMSPHPPNTIPSEWEQRYGTAESNELPIVDFEQGDFKNLPLQTKFLQGMVDIPPSASALKALGLSNPINDSLSLKTVAMLQEQAIPSQKWIAASRAYPKALKGKPDLAAIASGRYNYYNQVAFVDDQIGRLMTMLDDELQYGSRLLVIFTSDHGALLHDHGVPDKHTLIGESPRVPLILRWPGHIQANSKTGMASLLDVTATILSAAHIPNEEWKEVAGFTLVGSKAIHRTAIALTDFFGYGVITRKWKLFYYPQHNETFLFDRISDRSDRVNRYDGDAFSAADFGPYKVNSGGSGKDSVVGGVMLYALLRWRSRQVPPPLKPEDMARLSRRGVRPYNIEGAKPVPWGVEAEKGLMEDLLAFS